MSRADGCLTVIGSLLIVLVVECLEAHSFPSCAIAGVSKRYTMMEVGTPSDGARRELTVVLGRLLRQCGGPCPGEPTALISLEAITDLLGSPLYSTTSTYYQWSVYCKVAVDTGYSPLPPATWSTCTQA